MTTASYLEQPVLAKAPAFVNIFKVLRLNACMEVWKAHTCKGE